MGARGTRWPFTITPSATAPCYQDGASMQVDVEITKHVWALLEMVKVQNDQATEC